MTSQARLPNTLYHVLVEPGGRPLKYREKGGGTYRQRKEAERQYGHLVRTGVNAKLFVTTPDWEEITLET